MCIPPVPFLRALFTPKTGNRKTRTRQGSDSNNRTGPFAGRIKAQVKIVKFEKNEEIFWIAHLFMIWAIIFRDFFWSQKIKTFDAY